MVKRLNKFGLKVDETLANFIDNEVLIETKIDSEKFWKSFNDFVSELSEKNKNLLEKRNIIKSKLDNWHQDRKDYIDYEEYKKYLEDIGYLVPEGSAFKNAMLESSTPPGDPSSRKKFKIP